MTQIVPYSKLALENAINYNDTLPTQAGKLAGRVAIGSTLAPLAIFETLASSLFFLIYLPTYLFNKERLYHQWQYMHASALMVVNVAKEVFNYKAPSIDKGIVIPEVTIQTKRCSTWFENIFTYRNAAAATAMVAIVCMVGAYVLYPQKSSSPPGLQITPDFTNRVDYSNKWLPILKKISTISTNTLLNLTLKDGKSIIFILCISTASMQRARWL